MDRKVIISAVSFQFCIETCFKSVFPTFKLDLASQQMSFPASKVYKYEKWKKAKRQDSQERNVDGSQIEPRPAVDTLVNGSPHSVSSDPDQVIHGFFWLFITPILVF